MQRKVSSLSEAGVGMVAVIVVAIVATITGYFYLAPPNEETVTFTTRDAVSLRGGEDVRISGVSVGTVKDLGFARDAVRVTLAVDSPVPLGDQTRVEVRLLTAVGGYFVTLLPAGHRQSGHDLDIPIDRVTVPYTVADILQELPKVTDHVNGTSMDKILGQIGEGLTGNSGAIRNVVAGMQSLATVIDNQRTQIDTTLRLVSEYSATFNQSREYIFGLVRKINIVLSTYYTYRAGFSEAFSQMGGVLLRAGALAKFYVNHKESFAQVAQRIRDSALALRNGMDGLINNLTPLRDRLTALGKPVASDTGESLDGTTICLPLAGRKC